MFLIATILNEEQLKSFYDLAYSLGMDLLLEVHNEEEMQRAINIGANIVGVNNRDLRDFTISLETTKRLIQYLENKAPEHRLLFVSESGVISTEDIEFVKECHVDALLIGRAFMEAEHPLTLEREWKAIYNS